MSVKVAINSGSSFSCNWPFGILKPDGTVLAQTTGCGTPGFMEPATLSATGSYTVFFKPLGADTGTVTVNLYDVVDLTGPITPNGAGVVETIAQPGQNVYLTFAGTAGHRMSVTVAINSGSSFSCNWPFGFLNPDGSVLAQTTNCGTPGGLGPTTLPATGTYTVFFNPLRADTGTVTLTLTDANGTAEVHILDPPVRPARVENLFDTDASPSTSSVDAALGSSRSAATSPGRVLAHMKNSRSEVADSGTSTGARNTQYPRVVAGFVIASWAHASASSNATVSTADRGAAMTWRSSMRSVS
jgi:hypothetical protein